MQLVTQTDYSGFYKRQVAERLQFQYPPYYRMVKFTIIHINRDLVNDASNELAFLLRKHFDKRVLGPEYPLIARVKNRYHKQIMLKLQREASSKKVRYQIQQCLDQLQRHPDYRKVRVLPDVDPN